MAESPWRLNFNIHFYYDIVGKVELLFGVDDTVAGGQVGGQIGGQILDVLNGSGKSSVK